MSGSIAADAAREAIVRDMLARRVSAIIRTEDPAVAREAMHAAVRGGFTMIEFTLSIPGAIGLVAEFAADPRLLVGVGTVMDRDQTRAAVAAGARFIVSPVLEFDVLAEAQSLGVAGLPGTYTATEMWQAHRAGADFVKLFPAPADIAKYIVQLRGPMPYLRVFPTAGVTRDNFIDILQAGAAGVGFVSSLFEPSELKSGNFRAIEERAASIITRLAQA